MAHTREPLLHPMNRTNCQHVAIIMDGNGRWAKKQKKQRTFGHFSGSENVRNIAIAANDLGIKALTLYAFSTENWQRPIEEVDYLMKLPEVFFSRFLDELMQKNIRITSIGNLSAFPADTRRVLEMAIERTKENSGLILNFAMNYGGRDEIVRAVRRLVDTYDTEQLKNLSEEMFESALDTAGLPEVDLLIRTSGEVRISNFLLWQLAYSEMIFPEVAWPEFTAELFNECIDEFNRRDRRFGGVK